MDKDKRKCRRYPFLAIASVNTTSKDLPKTVTSLVSNISYSGLGITSYTQFNEGTYVLIRLKKIMGANNDELLNGTVAYSYKQNDSYYMGIALSEELHPDKQPKLFEHFSNTIRFG